MSTKAVPLTEFEIEEWRKLLDTLMHDASMGTTIRWKQELRALATIDALCTINDDLLAALKAAADAFNDISRGVDVQHPADTSAHANEAEAAVRNAIAKAEED